MTNPRMEAAILDLRATLTMMADIETHQTERLRDLLQFHDRTEELQVKGGQWRARTDERMAHLAETLAEVGHKLNGLIG